MYKIIMEIPYAKIAEKRMRNLKMKNSLRLTFYLSGKISGLHKTQYENHFYNSACKLNMSHYFVSGDTIINPCDLTPFLGIKTWLFYVITDVFNLLKSDAVVFQSNWVDSKGAKIEMWFALLFNKMIILQ